MVSAISVYVYVDLKLTGVTHTVHRTDFGWNRFAPSDPEKYKYMVDSELLVSEAFSVFLFFLSTKRTGSNAVAITLVYDRTDVSL